VRVTNSSQLASALAATTPSDIVLADGVYDNASPFSDVYGHRLYAEHLGGAVLRTGVELGGNSGPGGEVVRGLAFDVSDPAKTNVGGIINVWGTGKNVQVLDTTFEGHSAVGDALVVQQPDGFVGQRLVARDFTSDGISIDSYPNKPTFAKTPLLTDVDVANVSRPVPRSSNGTAEACVWLANDVTFQRAKLRNCAWMGLWTGFQNAGSLNEDVDVDGTPVGVYLEHFTTGSTFQRMHVGPSVTTGVNCEWADPAWNSLPACSGDYIQDSTFDTGHVGVYLDDGTQTTTIRRCVFLHQSAAGIVDYHGVGNVYAAQGNDFTGILSSAVPVSLNHL
jgi:hypothetical protein